MRTSERFAIAALTLMVAPAFLAFPALGVWWAIDAWPGLTTTQRMGFWVSLVALALTAPYVVRRHLDALWYGRTKKLSLWEEALILAPSAVGAWSLTGSWSAAFVALYLRLLFPMMRILDPKRRTEPADDRASSEPEDVELSLIDRLARWLKSRRRSSVGQRTITMGTRRDRSRRSRRP